MSINVSVIGASGYTGVELIRLLAAHPEVHLKYLVSEHNSDKDVAAVYPHLSKFIKDKFSKGQAEQIAQESDVVFLALPHTQSIPWVQQCLNFDCKIIDLSADLRLNDGEVYSAWYQYPAAPSQLLNDAIYGLAEINKPERIKSAKLIANPGCYPTATILGVAPLLANNLIDTKQTLVIDAKSGVSGAGRGLHLNTHFCEATNNFSAYQIAGKHRHIPEIEQELAKLARAPVEILFTPHLLPMPRGLMATIYCPLNADYSFSELTALYQRYYQTAHFINVNMEERPALKNVIGSNFCNISLHPYQHKNYLVVVSCIDNLLKGAAGQAIQNMNLMQNFPEMMGLQHISLYP